MPTMQTTRSTTRTPAHNRNDAANHTAARTALAQMYESHRPFLAHYVWEWEMDRFGELTCVLLAEAAGFDYSTARRAVHVLAELNLLSAPVLAALTDRQLLADVFSQLGVEAANAARGADLLVGACQGLQRHWGGYVHLILRAHAAPIIADLVHTLADVGEDPSLLEKVATVWLQNVAGFPILVRDAEHVRAFCNRFGLSHDEFVALADTSGLNLPVIDDVVAFDHQQASRHSSHAGHDGDGRRTRGARRSEKTPRAKAARSASRGKQHRA